MAVSCPTGYARVYNRQKPLCRSSVLCCFQRGAYHHVVSLQTFALTDLTKTTPAEAEMKLQAMISAASGIIATMADAIASLSKLIIDADLADQIQVHISQTMGGLQNVTAAVHEALVKKNATITNM